MVNDKILGMTTIVLFGISSLLWIIFSLAGIAILSLSPSLGMFLMTAIKVIMVIARYAALVSGLIAVFRTKGWQAEKWLLISNWAIVGWYLLLFLLDLVFIVLLLFSGSMIGSSGGTGSPSPPSVPVSVPRGG